jgi:GTP-dependent phosphoenolpyruvate carboxykinase
VATIHVHRERAPWKDRLRAYKIEVDGEVVAKLKDGESTAIEVEPGERTVVAKIDWAGSPPVTLTVGEHDVVHVAVANDVNTRKFWRGLGGVLDEVVANRGTYLKLSVIDPPG